MWINLGKRWMVFPVGTKKNSQNEKLTKLMQTYLRLILR